MITRECYSPAQAWWAGLVGPRAGLARACVETEVGGVALGPRRLERLVELLTAAVPEFPLLGTYADGNDDSSALFGQEGGPTLQVVADADSARLYAWAQDHAAAKALVRTVRRALPRTTAEVGQVAIAFWRGDGPRGQVDADVRDVACPTFESIADNYVPGSATGCGRWPRSSGRTRRGRSSSGTARLGRARRTRSGRSPAPGLSGWGPASRS